MTDGDDPGRSDADADVPEETDIRPLDDQTVARIAAGEVVERPASVVKELVENSLDADASRIEVAVEEGGIDRIAVTDDGVGMTEADLRAAVREHTTSKLQDADELERVRTLGFRGEALHTIGAVSRMTVTSRPRADATDSAAAAETGTRLRYEGGEVESVEPAAHPEGTTVEVADLFYNTPARRKYLAEPRTEFRHVSRVVGRYALANPDVAVSLSHDGDEVFATTGDGDRTSAVLAVYGRDVAESMIEVDADAGEDLADGSDRAVERVAGLVSHPETNRASREYLATYVNGRYVEADAIREGILEAYGGQLAADRYPFAVLFVDVPRERVDVNVHPRKLAVRFDDPAAVRDAVADAVRDALLDAGLVRSSAPRGVSAPDEAAVEPQTLDDVASGADAGDGSRPASGSDDEGQAAAASGDESQAASVSGTEASTRAGDPPAESVSPDAASSGTCSDPPDPATTPADRTSREPGERAADDSSGALDDGSEASDHTSEALGDSAETLDDTSGAPSSAPEPADGSDGPGQRTLAGYDAAPTIEGDSLPSLRVLGQLHDTYVVAEDEDGLVLVDQHAADERVHFERLREAVETGSAQALAEPVELSLTPAEAETVDAVLPALERLGFHADREGDRLLVRSVPTVLDEQLDPEALRDVLAAVEAGEDGARTVEALADELLADLACAPAVTSHTSLTEGSVGELLAALDGCENPFECPHGRPTVVRVDAAELEERFERDYPGHGERRQ